MYFKQILNVTLVLSLFVSCSSFKRSVVASAVTGLIVGAAGGATFSPDAESVNQNAYLFGIAGAAIGVGAAYFLKEEDKSKKQITPMIMEESLETHKELPLFDFSPHLKNVRPEVSFKPVKKFEVPIEKLPKSLEGKVKKQFIIEYEADARTLNIGNRTIQISPFKAWEHVYE